MTVPQKHQALGGEGESVFGTPMGQELNQAFNQDFLQPTFPTVCCTLAKQQLQMSGGKGQHEADPEGSQIHDFARFTQDEPRAAPLM